MEEQSFDEVAAEQRELDILNNVGMEFDVARRWTALFGKKDPRKWRVRPLTLHTMDRLSAEYIKLDLDEELIEQDVLLGVKTLVRQNALRCAKIVAIAVLNMNPFRVFLTWILTAYFYRRITSRMLVQLAAIINGMNNYGDFTRSIRLLSTARTTRPQLMERKDNED